MKTKSFLIDVHFEALSRFFVSQNIIPRFRCEDFYWWNGTVCTPCNCHNNSAYCNYTTGECIDCNNNTTGWYCDVCDDGLYGNATVQECQGWY